MSKKIKKPSKPTKKPSKGVQQNMGMEFPNTPIKKPTKPKSDN